MQQKNKALRQLNYLNNIVNKTSSRAVEQSSSRAVDLIFGNAR
jgi:hypothetical protein